MALPFVLVTYIVAVTCTLPNWTERGQFGDMFGAFTAVVNALGLLGLYLTLRQQLRALEIQNQQLELQTRANTVTTLSMFHERWTSRKLLLARQQVSLQHENGDPPALDWGRLTVATFFEEMGILVKAQGIDETTVWHLYCYTIEGYHEMLQPSVGKVIKQSDDENTFSEFRLLFLRMRDINREKASKDFGSSDEDKSTFAKSEGELCTRLLETGKST